MKKLIKLKTLFSIAAIAFACSTNKDQQDSTASSESPSDTVSVAESATVAEPEHGTFLGEYLIGDGNTYMVPVTDAVEMRDGTGKTSDVFYFQGKESDTLSVYSNKDKSVTFKMNPGHKAGRYYSADEELPVEWVGEVPEE